MKRLESEMAKQNAWKRHASHEDWLYDVPRIVSEDSLWSFETYRKALFLADLAWHDSEKMLEDGRGRAIAWQLIDSTGSVAANIEEGYGRGFGKDYARFLRIALGSARETKGWYYRGRHVYSTEMVTHQLALLEEIISGLIVTAKQQRDR